MVHLFCIELNVTHYLSYAILQPNWAYKEDGYYEQSIEFLGQERTDAQYPLKSFFDAFAFASGRKVLSYTFHNYEKNLIMKGTNIKVGEKKGMFNVRKYIVGLVVLVIVCGGSFFYLNEKAKEPIVTGATNAVVEHFKNEKQVDIIVDRVNFPVETDQYGPNFVTVMGHVKDEKKREIWALVNITNFSISDSSLED